ncbi:MAG: 16S rRNA (cytidine(1402)-2'-O)-methyltransferase [Eubacteriaceae bacterium]|jgi:16S rRNA (cytidine1402-2'-O)-methyltransferase
MSGKLTLVGTPIGNLGDMSFRAVKTLEEADRIACEDTRQTIKLLNHFEIKNRLEAYHKYNEQKESERLIGLLQDGENIALVSDAGLPVISDPGNIIVRKCRQAGIEVEVIPGPNAGLTGLMLSGLDAGSFLFLGFLGKSTKDFKAGIKRIAESKETVILYESPHRLMKLLQALAETVPEREISISREITKKFEETLTGTPQEMLDRFTEKAPKGEFVVIVSGGTEDAGSSLCELTEADHVAHYQAQGMSEKDAMKAAARDRNVSKRDIYNALKR